MKPTSLELIPIRFFLYMSICQGEFFNNNNNKPLESRSLYFINQMPLCFDEIFKSNYDCRSHMIYLFKLKISRTVMIISLPHPR